MTEKHVAVTCACCAHDARVWCRRCNAFTRLDYHPKLPSSPLAFCAGCHRRILP